METDEEQPRLLPFQLQFDKPVASQIKIAEWNPEKDLLAMVTEDSKILLHRFNWQRLWTISPGRCITSLCWRPDGKALAVGLDDGIVSFHDVENGKLLRRLEPHTVAVVCLNWEEDRELNREDSSDCITFEDRTPRFFPVAPTPPRMPGVVSGDTGFIDDSEDSYQELSSSSYQRFNVLCSADKDGNICFSVFGIFPIGKINIHNFSVSTSLVDKQSTYQLMKASTYKVALSKDLCHLAVMCSGEFRENMVESRESQMPGHNMHGSHVLVLDTSIFMKRKNELHQLAQQASNIEELIEVIRASLSVMSKQWSDAMHTFQEKFGSLSTLIVDHALESSPQEEFLSLLCGTRTSPAVHQFLVNTLGEVGVKRISKVVCGAGKELQRIVIDHMQPAAEMIAFRMGELRGLSRWRARYGVIGLDETLISSATEKSGMILVQIELFMRVVSSVELQFSNFFSWLLKCIKLLMQEPSDQLMPYSGELVIIFLKFLYDQDPVKELLSEVGHDIEVDLAAVQRVKELVLFGGFSDCEFLQRTLAKEFQEMASSFKKAFQMPFITISRKIVCKGLLPLFPLPSSPASMPVRMSISYYEDDSLSVSSQQNCQHGLVDYVCFQMPNEPSSDISNHIGIVRGFMDNSSTLKKGCNTSLEAVLLSIPAGYNCVDLSLYKDTQVVLLLNKTETSSESSGEARMMVVQASELPFASISRSTSPNIWKMHQLKDSAVELQIENEKVRCIPHSVIAPLAVSASRGVACVFAARKRALVYILDEDEDDAPETE
ncbi:anaphase-promoting complex subunit 4 isoform X2 [Mercurialis annua]|uniref:anaphase-promoting complex subunit 4 isoform X2 n=1 Tax=Mercurialis annua TaxID=3986 RepID=UPI0021609FD4|nr:anaphase-promoting complex subunit 4 isoform X2 [Mercurialis annua]